MWSYCDLFISSFTPPPYPSLKLVAILYNYISLPLPPSHSTCPFSPPPPSPIPSPLSPTFLSLADFLFLKNHCCTVRQS